MYSRSNRNRVTVKKKKTTTTVWKISVFLLVFFIWLDMVLIPLQFFRHGFRKGEGW